MKPEFITFTGFDDRTKVSDMIDISKKYPVEWGVLVSPTNKDARFPCIQAIKELVAKNLFFKLSLHCCGGYSKKVQLNGEFPFDSVSVVFKRVQLNGKAFVQRHKLVSLHKKTGKEFILQKKVFDPTWINFDREGIDYLFDTSGGRGEMPDNFPEYPGYFCGYAGGINPNNVLDVLKNINAPEGADYWIDMESGVRTNGWFDLDKVVSVCSKVYG